MKVRVFTLVGVLGVVACLTLHQEGRSQSKQGKRKQPSAAAAEVTPSRTWEERIRSALNAKKEWQLRNTSLQDLVKFIEKQCNVPVDIDRKSLNEVGLGGQSTVSLNATKMSGRAALHHLLSPLGLTWTVRHDVLLITTPEVCETALFTRTFPVTDLTRIGTAKDGRPIHDSDSFVEAMTTLVEPDSWNEVGGPGVSKYFAGSLVVTQTRDVMSEVENYLAAYRNSVAASLTKDVSAVSIRLPSKESKELTAALGKRINLVLQATPLNEMVVQLRKQTGVNILIDGRALEEVGVDSSVKFSVQVRDSVLSTSLRRILDPIGLTWTVRHEAIVITTPESAETSLTTRFYPVQDLIQQSRKYDGGMDDLTELITSAIAPDSWEEVGGAGAITALSHPCLAFSQTEDVHESVERLLAKLRTVAKQAETLEPQGEKNAKGKDQPTVLVVYSPQSISAKDAERLIRSLIDEKDLNSHSKAVIETTDSKLIIRHTSAMQRKVQQLLFQLDGSIQQGQGGGGGSGGGGGGFFTP